MSDHHKSGKKDQTVQREVLEELRDEQAPERRSDPKYQNPNRDQSRGDWDRSGEHTGG